LHVKRSFLLNLLIQRSAGVLNNPMKNKNTNCYLDKKR